MVRMIRRTRLKKMIMMMTSFTFTLDDKLKTIKISSEFRISFFVPPMSTTTYCVFG